MSTATGFIGISMAAFDIGLAGFVNGGAADQTTATFFRFTHTNGRVEEYEGTGFTYSGGFISGGVINTLRLYDGAQQLFEIGGVSIQASAFRTWALGGDTESFLNAVFSGPDAFTGSGGGFADTLIGYGGNDSILSLTGDDSILGGEGFDTLIGGGGDDTIDGGPGDLDRVSYASASAGVTVNLSITGIQNTTSAGMDRLVNVEYLEGSLQGDTLIGDAGANSLSGATGDDSISGGAENDSVNAGAGDDTVDGGAGAFDMVFYDLGATGGVKVNLSLTGPQTVGGGFGVDQLSNIERITGSSFADTLIGDAQANLFIGGVGDDSLDGGAGVDGAGYFSATSAVTVSLAVAGPQNVGGGQGVDVLANMEQLHGSVFGDTLIGDAGVNDLFGNAGDDSLSGGDGADNLNGGLGSDTLDGGAGLDAASFNFAATSGVTVDLKLAGVQDVGGGLGGDRLVSIENLYGSAFGDTLIGDDARNVLQGLQGDDSLSGGLGDDALFGGAGDDTLDGGAGTGDGVSYIDATAGVVVSLSIAGPQAVGAGLGVDTILNVEVLAGSAFNDSLIGDANDNTLYGQPGDDTLFGLAGDDAFVASFGADSIDGGAGSDTLLLNGGVVDFTVDLTIAGPQSIGGGRTYAFADIENLSGGTVNDRLSGDAGGNRLDGAGGADTLEGRAGADTLVGGAGVDQYQAATFDDLNGDRIADYEYGERIRLGQGLARAADLRATVVGAETLIEIDGDDNGAYETSLTIGRALTGALVLGDNGMARNVIQFLAPPSGGGGGDGGEPAPTPTPTAGDDSLVGSQGSDTQAGGEGADRIDAGEGADFVDGDQGDDSVSGSEGGDFIRGGADNDTVDGGEDADTVNGNQGSDSVNGGGGDDTVYGGQGSDTVDGGAGDDGHVNGNLGEDVVHGGDGGDTVYGGRDNDTVFGDAGDDRISGDLGDDALWGGTGSDTFAFAATGGHDWIGDFNAAEGDRILLPAGQEYTVTSYLGQTVIMLGGGATLGLAGVSGFDPGWIVFV